MSKRSNKGKAYFYAKGQRDATSAIGCSAYFWSKQRDKLYRIAPWVFHAWNRGYNGY
jgi:hypothetical protein